MAQLFGFIGNRPDLASRVLHVEESSLHARARGERLGWGVGFYQAGEVLLRRRPLDPHPDIPLTSLTQDVRTNILIGNVRPIDNKEPHTENTEPFRYRTWLFAHAGKVSGFSKFRDRLLNSLPDFLQRNVRGETEGEVLFFTFLSFLHDANVLNDSSPIPKITEGLRGTCALLDRMAREEGHDNAGHLAMLCSNGTNIAAFNRGRQLAYRVVRGEDDIDALLPEDGLRKRRLPDLALVRFTIIASDILPTPSWTTLPEACTVVMHHLEEPLIETLDR